VYYTERKPKNKKRGRPGNEANPCKCNGTIFTNNRDDGEVKKLLYGYTFGGGVNTVNEHNLGG